MRTSGRMGDMNGKWTFTEDRVAGRAANRMSGAIRRRVQGGRQVRVRCTHTRQFVRVLEATVACRGRRALEGRAARPGSRVHGGVVIARRHALAIVSATPCEAQ